MIETQDLILDKGKQSDWKDMYQNVWCRKEAAQYMFWNRSLCEEDAYRRMERTIAYQEDHDAWLVYEKSSGKAIGFAGLRKINDTACEESGICLGPAYVEKGYGTQILDALIQRARDVYHAKTFYYDAREDNYVSRRLARSFGFEVTDAKPTLDERDGNEYVILRYRKKL